MARSIAARAIVRQAPSGPSDSNSNMANRADRAWTLAGFAALAGAVGSAALAQSPETLSGIGAHMALCLSGQAPVDGAVATFLGHCAACWAAAALSIVGGAALALGRTPRR